jgi:3-oxoacyl-[acyl-carrier-protein] synthase II
MVKARRFPPLAVTGAGLATSLGFGVAENWRRLLAGESEIREHAQSTFLAPVPLPVRLGAALDREQLAERIHSAVPRQIWNTSAEVCHLWLLVALEALTQAGLSARQTAYDPARIGIFAGNGGGPVHFIEREYANIYTAEKAFQRDVSRMGVPKYMASSLAAQLSLATGFRGPAITVNTACSSGATALLAALDAIRLGRIDCAVAGGADMPLAGTTLKGFANLGALSTRNDLGALASRPFDAERDGFVLGEGAAALVLERPERAAARGAAPLARFFGGAASAEAHNLLAQKEDGSEILHCLRLALADAELEPGAVRHVYTHGTGTPINDRCEALALNTLVPHRPTISATKALLGHTIGAAAAIDSVLAVQTLGTGQPVPVAHVRTPDPACGLRFAQSGSPLDGAAPDGDANARGGAGVPGGAGIRSGAVLINSFAFGGHNAALIFAAPDGSPDALEGVS